MPIKKLPRLTAWSFSRLTLWEQCPLRCKLLHIDKIKEPERAVFARGRDVEAETIGYIKGKGALPESCARFPKELAALRKIAKRILFKQQVAFDQDWGVTGWFDSNAWLRVEFDLVYEELIPGLKKYWQVHVIDLKTGKIYEDKVAQVELYNLCALLLPEDMVSHKPEFAFSELYYLDQGETRERSLMLKAVPKEKAKWQMRAAPMLVDSTFQPRPSYLCRFCFYSKSYAKQNGGGLCQF